MAAEERLQARLAETYVTLTDYALRTQQWALTSASGTVDEYQVRNPPFADEDWVALRARVYAFASDAVRDHFEGLMKARVTLAVYLDEGEEMARYGQEDLAVPPDEEQRLGASARAVPAARKALAENVEAVVELIRRELSVKRGVKPVSNEPGRTS